MHGVWLRYTVAHLVPTTSIICKRVRGGSDGVEATSLIPLVRLEGRVKGVVVFEMSRRLSLKRVLAIASRSWRRPTVGGVRHIVFCSEVLRLLVHVVANSLLTVEYVCSVSRDYCTRDEGVETATTMKKNLPGSSLIKTNPQVSKLVEAWRQGEKNGKGMLVGEWRGRDEVGFVGY